MTCHVIYMNLNLAESTPELPVVEEDYTSLCNTPLLEGELVEVGPLVSVIPVLQRLTRRR
jgi:hypothetical protein